MYDLLDTVRACEERQGKYADIWKRVGDRIEAQEKRNNELEAALRYYAFEDPFVSYDDSLIARAALAGEKNGKDATE